MDKRNSNILTEKDLTFQDSSQSIGSGAFGKVYLARITKTGQLVAVKNVFQDRRYKNRELSIMQELDHPNIVKLISYYYTRKIKCKEEELYLNCIMDYVPETLSILISINKQEKKKFPSILLKIYSYQMLKSIGYLHSLGICHRDIKPQNILIDPDDYTLKLCDFGCAKRLIKGEPNIAYICSRYYRPPELIIGSEDYTPQVDVWSIGCVIAELVLNKPIFQGRSASDQMIEIIKVLGTPTQKQIKEMNRSSKIIRFPPYQQRNWYEYFDGIIDDILYIDLVSKLLVYEPNVRLTPYKALCHPFFDDLRKSELVLPNGKGIPDHLFQFTEEEMRFDRDSVQFLVLSAKKEKGNNDNK